MIDDLDIWIEKDNPDNLANYEVPYHLLHSRGMSSDSLYLPICPEINPLGEDTTGEVEIFFSNLQIGDLFFNHNARLINILDDVRIGRKQFYWKYRVVQNLLAVEDNDEDFNSSIRELMTIQTVLLRLRANSYYNRSIVNRSVNFTIPDIFEEF